MWEAISKKSLATFYADSPLYSKVEFMKGLPLDLEAKLPDSFCNDVAFKFFCPHESEVQTFRVGNTNPYNSDFVFSHQVLHVFSNKTKKVDWSYHLVGICQSCGYEIDFLINLFSDEEVDSKQKNWPTLYLRKIGQYPAVERMPESEVYSYLTDEDKENYKKALANLSVSYGIGAFAYFRRVIENEIKRIVEDLTKLEFDGVEHIRKAWKEYEGNHQMTPLIEKIYPYLPQSLKEATGDNPIKLLHQQLSGGIHEYSEEQCLQKAKQIDVLLRYVIKKVNSERFELKALREAMNGLRK